MAVARTTGPTRAGNTVPAEEQHGAGRCPRRCATLTVTARATRLATPAAVFNGIVLGKLTAF